MHLALEQEKKDARRNAHDTGAPQHGVVGEAIDDVQVEHIALMKDEMR